MRWIDVRCLNCRHQACIAERDLREFGLEPDTSLVTVTKRLVCARCGSKAVTAYRHSDNDAGPSLVPEA